MDFHRILTGSNFRRDLFIRQTGDHSRQHFSLPRDYRLNVFPIHMPALRERKEDIQLLVRHLVQKFGRRLDEQIDIITADTMNALASWHWPGNVRELENVIERSVIRSPGPILNVPLAELRSPPSPDESQ